MDGNILITVFAAIDGIVMLGMNIVEFNQYKEQIDPEITRHKYKLYDFSKGIRIAYGAICAVGVIFAIISYIHADFTTGAIAVVTGCLFAGQYLLAFKRYRMYYNDESFLIGGERIQYKGISDVQEIRFLPFAFKRLITLNGKEYRVSNGCMKIIDDQRKKQKEMKKDAKRKVQA
jgi:hypothetical protein